MELMQMLDLSRQTRRNSLQSQAEGFSLLEMLTVLFIIGTAAALATPNLPLMFDRIAFSAEKDTLIRDINALPYAAIKANQDLVLSTNMETADLMGDSIPAAGLAFASEASAPYFSPSTKMATLDLPDGWNLKIAEPILYKSSGFCSGGYVSATAGRLQYDFILTAPYCQITE